MTVQNTQKEQLEKDLETAWARENWKEVEEAAQAMLAVDPKHFDAATSLQAARIKHAAQAAPMASTNELRSFIYGIHEANLLVIRLAKNPWLDRDP